MTPLLTGKVALVTGGARGLGRAICRTFRAEGARVAFTYARNEDAKNELLRDLGADGLAARVGVCDVPGTEAFLRSIEDAFGPLDILVNNAAITQNLPLALLEEDDWDRVMDTNVKGTFLTSRVVLRGMMRRRKGVILNVGSLAGERAIEAPIHYCTSKAAIRGFTEALAKEVARHGIRVLDLAPGLLEDGLGRNLPEHRLAEYLKHCALGRVGTFEEIARLAAFLVSERNAYMSGATIVADGGV